MTLARDIKAEIELLATEHGGRSTPAKSGIRPQFYYHGHDWVVALTFINQEWVAPGESVQAYVTFLSPQKHVDKIHPGMPFLVREGSRVVGFGAVKEIVELEASAKRVRDARS